MIYATRDFNGETIEGIEGNSARIEIFESLEAAKEEFLKSYSDLDGLESAEMVQGNFGDYWFRFYVSFDDVNISPFSKEDLFMQLPGSHPGDDCFWVTPKHDVWVLKVTFKEEEDEE
jgi:hypothetical protein